MSKKKSDIIFAVNELKKIMVTSDEDGNQATHPHTKEELFDFVLNGFCFDVNKDKKFFDDDCTIWLTKSQILEFRNMLNDVVSEIYPDEMSDIFINE